MLMLKGMFTLKSGGCVLLTLALISCRPIARERIAAVAQDAAACPPQIQEQVKLAASAVAGRRGVISLSPGAAAAGLHLVSHAVTITTFGGTLEGMAGATEDGPKARERPHITQISDGRAIEVTPGRLRIAPFVVGATLRPQTLSMDLLVTPGGSPLDEMVVATEALWDSQLHPLPPERVAISLVPLRHFTMYDQVEAALSLDFDVSRAPAARQRWTCSAESRFTLVDRSATAPNLWDLRKSAEYGPTEWWLALFSARAGAFRAL